MMIRQLKMEQAVRQSKIQRKIKKTGSKTDRKLKDKPGHKITEKLGDAWEYPRAQEPFCKQARFQQIWEVSYNAFRSRKFKRQILCLGPTYGPRVLISKIMLHYAVMWFIIWEL